MKRKINTSKVVPANTQPVIEPSPPLSVSVYIAQKPKIVAATKANQNAGVLSIDLNRSIDLALIHILIVSEVIILF